MTSFGPFASFLCPPGQEVPVVFSWNSFFFTPDTQVIVEVAADRRFNRIVQTMYIVGVDNGVATGGAVTIALAQGNYWWRVFPVNAESREPANRLFPSGTLEIIPAAAPLLFSPLHTTELIFPLPQSRVSLAWSAVEGAVAYLLEISARSDMESPAVSRQVEESLVTEFALDYGNWYWRVTPVFPPQIRGGATPSEVGAFSIIRGSPVLAPPVPAVVAGGRLMWSHDPNAASWFVELADNPAMVNPALRQNTSSNFLALPPEFQQAGLSWYWRVTALGGEYPAVSAVQSFVIPAPAIEEPPLLAVAEPQVVVEPEAPAPVAVEPRPPVPQFPALHFGPNVSNWDAMSAEFAASNQQTLAAIARFLEENAEFRLRIEGHANPTINPANILGRQREQILGTQPLSELRAQVVANRLAELSVDPQRLEPSGFGGERTIAAWEDTANWWRNRRAEFVLLE
jgi:outer membrane protein OmpA-like peptidoglycan-associated protein